MSEQIEERMNAAYELLEQGDADSALALGRELEELRHSSAFEIQALAHADLGDVGAAIDVLERGVDRVPGVWMLWQLLGNNYSDVGRAADALESFERALSCPNVDTPSLHYNIALALSRQERSEEALSHLDLGHVGSEDASWELVCRVTSLRIGLLRQLERYREALSEGRRLITEARAEGTIDEHLAPVLGEYASALWLAERDRTAAEEAAWQAIELDKHEQSAMWVLRELTDRASERGCLYQLLLMGRWHESLGDDEELPGFFTTYEVVADSADEAIEYARPFEPVSVRHELKIEESEVVEPRPGEPKGVYSVSAYQFFPGRELEEGQGA
ncbi:MAG: hypothetical protein GY937_21405 [bacterium]|nr:hypothetical protein [bacterium]